MYRFAVLKKYLNKNVDFPINIFKLKQKNRYLVQRRMHSIQVCVLYNGTPQRSKIGGVVQENIQMKFTRYYDKQLCK